MYLTPPFRESSGLCRPWRLVRILKTHVLGLIQASCIIKPAVQAAGGLPEVRSPFGPEIRCIFILTPTRNLHNMLTFTYCIRPDFFKPEKSQS